ncbi:MULTISPECIES: hypothetical protein [unclassified Xanthobacter]|uniref:hypothetical protein n=1 Tax=unclassified Xanthobacter TaxID=2623496 RepID=UPI001F3DCE20|nr:MULTISPECIES: hypothetical protein [unclassified Xanthobacter]
MAETEGLRKPAPSNNLDCLTRLNGDVERKGDFPEPSNRDGPPLPENETAAPTGIGSGSKTGYHGGGIKAFDSTERPAWATLHQYPLMEFRHFDWLRRAGVAVETITSRMPIRVAKGSVADDGCFDDAPEGAPFLVFEEAEDLVFWQPRTGALATWHGRAFALGEGAILDPLTYAFDCNLNLYANPLAWLQAGCDGCVVLDWSRAFDHLRHASRIAVSEDLLFLYRRHMKPARMPELSVLVTRKAVVA